MANPEHLQILQQGVEAWNQWRKQHEDIKPDLNEADLRYTILAGADLREADLFGATLAEAHLFECNLVCLPQCCDFIR